MSVKRQRCPGCDQDLPEEAYYASYWGHKGQACRDCQRDRQKRWAVANQSKLRSTRKEWAANNPNYFKDRHRLKRYGVTREDVERMLARQNYRCLGCQAALTEKSAAIDHSHQTGEVRGILCRNCNWALGNIREEPATLRRLMVYLDLDRSKVMIYVAGALKNPGIVDVGNALRKHGYEALDDWHSAGPDADDTWRDYEQKRGRTYIEALKGRAAQNVFYYDLAHIDLADAIVLVAPSGKSAHLELGYALGSGKPGFILDETEPSRYEVMPNLAWTVCYSLEELVQSLNTWFERSLGEGGTDA